MVPPGIGKFVKCVARYIYILWRRRSVAKLEKFNRGGGNIQIYGGKVKLHIMNTSSWRHIIIRRRKIWKITEELGEKKTLTNLENLRKKTYFRFRAPHLSLATRKKAKQLLLVEELTTTTQLLYFLPKAVGRPEAKIHDPTLRPPGRLRGASEPPCGGLPQHGCGAWNGGVQQAAPRV